jgi:hypothetical protein
MTELSEARAVERSLAARHERLCQAYDRGEPVQFALGRADVEWIRAKNRVADLESQAVS